MSPDDPRWEEFLDFSADEMRCFCGCGTSNPAYELMVKLQRVRTRFRRPIKITSGSRCVAHNEDVGGVDSSSHIANDQMESYAADIQARGSRERHNLLKHLMDQFNRIGIAKSFIHVDCDPSKPKEVIWLY